MMSCSCRNCAGIFKEKCCIHSDRMEMVIAMSYNAEERNNWGIRCVMMYKRLMIGHSNQSVFTFIYLVKALIQSSLQIICEWCMWSMPFVLPVLVPVPESHASIIVKVNVLAQESNRGSLTVLRFLIIYLLSFVFTYNLVALKSMSNIVTYFSGFTN